MKDVTVIIPSYVTDEQSILWLYECVQSALDQDCPVVVYDDGSKLVPEELITHFNNDNLSVYKDPVHHGVSYARNRAAERVSTKLMLPLDCDDLLVKGAVDKLYGLWEGIPVYPDISKFGVVEVPHFQLLNFSCDLLHKKLGISSVNVLHAVEQWRHIGGWNEHLDLYEDAEYNARLFMEFCGRNLHEPLVRYRQHETQKTRKIKNTEVSVAASRDILASLRRVNMGCPSCGGKRRSSTEAAAAAMSQVQPVNPTNMPGVVNDRVLSLYVGGKGQAAHYYKGIATHFAYKVIYGNYYYVDPADATSKETPGRRSLFIKVEKPAEVAQVEQQKLEEIARSPVTDKVKSPVVDIVVEPLPDITNMNVGDVQALSIDDDQAKILLEREKKGKGRSGVIDYLSKRFKID